MFTPSRSQVRFLPGPCFEKITFYNLFFYNINEKEHNNWNCIFINYMFFF